jgi:hypothetical protein
MVYFNQAWNTAERQAVESALAIRYGVGLASDHVDASGGTLWSQAANTGFINGVTAIGRDDTGNTDQRQSRNGNGGLITIGLDSIADAHDLHPNAFASDGDFLFWSHNGADGLPDSAGLPPGESLILDRIWQAREPNGEIGTIDLKFHMDAFGLPGSDLSDYTLYVKNASSDFNSGATSMAPDAFVAGDYLLFRGIDLDDGDRFTLATSSGLQGPAGLTAGLSFWFAADQNVTESSGVSDWGNLAPPSYDLTQPSSGIRLTYHSASNLLNFNPKVEFDGTTEYLAVTGLNYNPSNRIDQNAACVVFSTSHTGTNNWAFLDFDRSDYFNFNINSAGTLEFAVSDGTTDDIDGSISGLNDGVPQIGCFRYDNTLVNDVVIRADGSVAYNDDVKASSVQLGAGSTLTRYGFVGDGSEADGENGGRNNEYYEGDIAELVYFDGASPTDAEFDRLETYLAAKYGITLNHNYVASDGSTFWDISALSSYSNGIIVVGRDDEGGLLQKQSRSGEDGSVLSLGLGSLAATNAANANSFGGDMRFTVVGHNNGSTDATDVGVPAGYNIILNRTWYLEEVGGDPGNLYLQFDMNTAVLPGTVAGDFALVVKNGDADLSTGVTTYAATSYDGNTLDFSGVNLADGDYFSIASAGVYVGPSPAGYLENLELWFASDSAVSTSGSAVTAWGNSAPKAATGTQSSSPLRPALIAEDPGMNFNNSIRFDGINDYLPISQLNLETPVNTVVSCAVFRTSYVGTTSDDNWSLIDYDHSEWFNLFVRGDNGGIGFSFSTSSNTRDNYSTSTGFNDSLPHLVCARYDNSLTNDTYVRVDGVEEVNTNRESTGTKVGTVLNRYGFVGIGLEADEFDGTNNGGGYEGDMAEVLLYLDDTLSDAELDKIETYMGLKFGIHLDHDYVASNDAVIWDASTLAAYHNDVAGIGKDLSSGLDQRKSRSTNGDDLLTVWLGAHTDESSPQAFGQDLSFMLWGNDNGQLDTIQDTDMPSGIVKRIPREWRFAEQEVFSFSVASHTREIGQVSIQFDLSLLSGAAVVHPNVSEDSLLNLRLLVSASSNFSAASAYSPDAVSVANRTVTFSVPGGDIGDGSHITLGSTSGSPLPVEWASFEATTTDDGILLEWRTAAEINASHFEPQRSVDGLTWTSLGIVQAEGVSQGASYAFTDAEASEGWVFYRIRQLDWDGSEDFSLVRSVQVAGNPASQLYPIPVSDRLFARFDAARSGEAQWRIIDHTGRIHNSGNRSVQEGLNTWQWDVQELPEGWYRLVLADASGRAIVHQSFLVQRGMD